MDIIHRNKIENKYFVSTLQMKLITVERLIFVRVAWVLLYTHYNCRWLEMNYWTTTWPRSRFSLNLPSTTEVVSSPWSLQDYVDHLWTGYESAVHPFERKSIFFYCITVYDGNTMLHCLGRIISALVSQVLDIESIEKKYSHPSCVEIIGQLSFFAVS